MTRYAWIALAALAAFFLFRRRTPVPAPVPGQASTIPSAASNAAAGIIGAVGNAVSGAISGLNLGDTPYQSTVPLGPPEAPSNGIAVEWF